MSNGTPAQDASTQYSFGNPPPLGNPVTGAMIGTDPAAPQFEPIRKYRGDSLLQTFRMRDRLRNKAPMIGYGLGLANPEIARMIASAGFDFIFIDWEHTAIGIKEVTELIRWINLTGEGTTAVVVRVPTHEHNWIAWALDAGASGIILPHTETVEQAKAAVAAARFYTQGGHRSYPPFAMPLGINDGDHKDNALPWDIYNRSAVILQLESKKGADNADAIAAVEGVDGLMCGHMDLRFDLGLGYGGAMDEPEYLEGVGKILSAAKKHGDKPVLTFAQGPAAQEKLIQAGFRMLMVGSDGMDLAAGMRKQLNGAHEVVKNAWKPNP
ncbi:Pyruvate/Phosphoenolpyruvate kinase-like domain-containing protein [Kockovaella imperatae]|uniref:Pyruvate/Phosphoenolpyruvate kinase-like domain-containing protein n=1 Tax=Kockovaella imperatae TaxID=4999 RepID=A0A1Y1UUH1_9TREE|nr:Pyruvate/Phosphoenolpyruvate kinase-like domain-containing protein [Kockovaella imperatae]ORX41224.1 Pyruvate/Phosphoenolpyruvate kinase-like domain-containing protein [Kockovaella imperatae]